MVIGRQHVISFKLSSLFGMREMIPLLYDIESWFSWKVAIQRIVQLPRILLALSDCVLYLTARSSAAV